MLDISPEKLLVVMAIALAVLGPEGIPRLARGVGKARAGIRRLTADMPPEALHVVTNPRAALLDAVSGPRQAVSQAAAEPRSALADAIAAFSLTGTTPASKPSTATPAPDDRMADGDVADAGPQAVLVVAPDDPTLN